MLLRRKPNRLFWRITTLCLGLGLVAACRPTPEAPGEAVSPTPEMKIRLILEPIIASDADALAAAEVIFLGEVTAISPTRFNQDSGEYWDGAMPVHMVTFRVVEPLVDEIGLAREVTLTEMAGSPADVGTTRVQTAEGEAQYEATVSHQLTIGQEVVVLAARREFAWREGTRETLGFAVWAGDSYFFSDGQGNYRRNNSELPPMTLEELSSYIGE